MDSSSPCGHWSRALVPGGRGPVFIPALLTARGRLTDLLLLDFAARAGRRVGRPCLGQDYLVSRGTYGRNLGSPTRSAWPVMR
jgi:hypothetical protein